jgi:hypothetical protein
MEFVCLLFVQFLNSNLLIDCDTWFSDYEHENL